MSLSVSAVIVRSDSMNGFVTHVFIDLAILFSFNYSNVAKSAPHICQTLIIISTVTDSDRLSVFLLLGQ